MRRRQASIGTARGRVTINAPDLTELLYKVQNCQPLKSSVEKYLSMRSGNTVTTCACPPSLFCASTAAAKFRPELGPTGKPCRISLRVVSIATLPSTSISINPGNPARLYSFERPSTTPGTRVLKLQHSASKAESEADPSAVSIGLAKTGTTGQPAPAKAL